MKHDLLPIPTIAAKSSKRINSQKKHLVSPASAAAKSKKNWRKVGESESGAFGILERNTSNLRSRQWSALNAGKNVELVFLVDFDANLVAVILLAGIYRSFAASIGGRLI